MRGYYIQKNNLLNLKIAAPSEFAGGARAMGVPRDWPQLAQHPKIRVGIMNSWEPTSFLDDAGRAADAYVGNRAVAFHIMTQELMDSLAPYGRARGRNSVLAIGVRYDWPELASLLDRALVSLSYEERNRIHRQWVNLDWERPSRLSSLCPRRRGFRSSACCWGPG